MNEPSNLDCGVGEIGGAGEVVEALSMAMNNQYISRARLQLLSVVDIGV
jgi:hypothetical protein